MLDNCEHLLDAVAEVVEELLSAGDQLRVLATSREALDLSGERTFRIPSLAVKQEGGDGPALLLLADRAAAVQDGFRIDEHNRGALTTICEQVDGIPFALELAAVQLRHLTPAELAALLDDRFRMLVGGRGRRQQRQQTLQAMMDWSWALLGDDERQLLAEVSVFAGGWSLEAVTGISRGTGRDAVGVLGSLVAKSLVVADQNRWGSRYRLLETVRLYAALKLLDRGATADTREAHASWYVRLVEGWSFEEQWSSAAVASRLRSELDNLRAAVLWLHEEGDHPRLAKLVRSCALLWRENVAASEALEWCEPSVGPPHA